MQFPEVWVNLKWNEVVFIRYWADALDLLKLARLVTSILWKYFPVLLETLSKKYTDKQCNLLHFCLWNIPYAFSRNRNDHKCVSEFLWCFLCNRSAISCTAPWHFITLILTTCDKPAPKLYIKTKQTMIGLFIYRSDRLFLCRWADLHQNKLHCWAHSVPLVEDLATSLCTVT